MTSTLQVLKQEGRSMKLMNSKGVGPGKGQKRAEGLIREMADK